MSSLDLLRRYRLVPVVALDRAADAEPLAEALGQGGLPCAEITLRTPAAIEAIRRLAGRPDFLVGAGTVHRIAQAEEAVRAGAEFLVSPGLNPHVVKWCQDASVPIVPGCATPTDLETALDLGLNIVKFFPAEPLGGIKMLQALSAPFGELSFLPTGGINGHNAPAYLQLPSVIAVGGSWMVKRDWLIAGAFEQVAAATREAMQVCGRVDET